ncbi:MAG: hypothetical protein IJI43_01815 [Bacilli bacterium]|nr:hypothetical protein [Bacilli bacterium]
MTREELNHHKQDIIDVDLNREKRKKLIIGLFKFIILLILLVLIFYFYNTYVSTGGIIVKEKRIINTKVPNEFNGTKIVQFSDLKYGTTIDSAKVKEIVKLINSRKPDIVVFTGNLVSEDYEISSKDQEELTESLNSIEAKLGKYAIYGYEDDEVFRTVFNQSDFTILANSFDLIYKNNTQPILLVGLDSLLEERLDIDKSFSYKKTNNNIYTIALINETDPIDDVLKQKPDLILAGGNLNGTIRLPLGIFKKPGSKKYLNPYYKINDTHLFVSSGLGTDGIGMRINNHPSINLIRLSNK